MPLVSKVLMAPQWSHIFMLVCSLDSLFCAVKFNLLLHMDDYSGHSMAMNKIVFEITFLNAGVSYNCFSRQVTLPQEPLLDHATSSTNILIVHFTFQSSHDFYSMYSIYFLHETILILVFDLSYLVFRYESNWFYDSIFSILHYPKDHED